MGNQSILPRATGVNIENQKLWLSGSQNKAREPEKNDQIREQKEKMKQEEQSRRGIGGWAELPSMLWGDAFMDMSES